MQITLKSGYIVKDKLGLWLVLAASTPYHNTHTGSYWWDHDDRAVPFIKCNGKTVTFEDPWPNHPNGGPDCILNISELYKGEA